MQIGAAETAGGDLHSYAALTRFGYVDLLESQRGRLYSGLFMKDHRAHIGKI